MKFVKFMLLGVTGILAQALFAAQGHPRLFVTPSSLDGVRKICTNGYYRARYEGWRKSSLKGIDAALPPEPDWLPKKNPDRAREFAKDFSTIRPPTQLMSAMGFVYMIGRDPKIGAEVRRRVLYYTGWNPRGPTSTKHNDEPAMSIVLHGTRAYDWSYDLYTPDERIAIESCLVERARQIYEVLTKRKFRESPTDSHLGRQIGFLAEMCCALMPEHPEMKPWYDYVTDVYRTVYPAWSKKDGGWNEGPHYWSAYMHYGLDSLTTIKIAMGEDLMTSNEFFSNTPWYFVYQCPPGSPISPFGDGWQAGPQCPSSMHTFAVLLRDPALLWFANAYRVGTDGVRDVAYDPEAIGLKAAMPTNLPGSRCFPAEGLVMSHASLTSAKDDVAFYFRSTPYGSVSHGHADQNSFCIAAFGEPLAIASGHYNYYGSPHHFQWMRTTKAKCAITYDGGKGQLYSAAAKGKILYFQDHGSSVAFAGEAAIAYGEGFSTVRREVVRLGKSHFLIRDTLESREPHAFEYNLHAVSAMTLNAAQRRISIVQGGAALDVAFLGTDPLAFSQSDAFDPPLKGDCVLRKNFAYPDQYHFRATAQKSTRQTFLTLLSVRKYSAPAFAATAETQGDGENPEVLVKDGQTSWRVRYSRTGAAPEVSEKFTFVSWNIGHFSEGVCVTSVISKVNVPAYLKEYRSLLERLDARIVGLAEYSPFFDAAKTMRTRDTLFANYPIRLEGPVRGAHVNSLMMRDCALVKSRAVDYKSHYQSTHHHDAVVTIGGREVMVVMTHLEPNWPCDHRQMRAEQLRQLLEDVAGYRHVIVAGDFNVKSKVEFEPLLEAGYAMANFEMKPTWPARAPRMAIDNIFTKGLKISDFQIIAEPKLSDHCLVSCSLEFENEMQ